MKLDIERIEQHIAGADASGITEAEAALQAVSTQLEENRVRLQAYKRGGAVIEGLADEFVIEGAAMPLATAKRRVDAMLAELRADPAGEALRAGSGIFKFLGSLGVKIAGLPG